MDSGSRKKTKGRALLFINTVEHPPFDIEGHYREIFDGLTNTIESLEDKIESKESAIRLKKEAFEMFMLDHGSPITRQLSRLENFRKTVARFCNGDEPGPLVDILHSVQRWGWTREDRVVVDGHGKFRTIGCGKLENG